MKISGSVIAIIGVAFILLTGVLMYFNYDSAYITMRNQYDAQVEQDRIVYDEVWKVIQQQAGVSEKYSDDFRRNYRDIMASRNYGGELMKWITEQNPNFSPDMYNKLMNTIESQRAKFTMVQTKLISYHNELKNLVQKAPARWFIGSREIPELILVTSSRTENAFQTGKDDDVELFNKENR